MVRDDERYHLAPSISDDDAEDLAQEEKLQQGCHRRSTRWLKLHYIFLVIAYLILAILYATLVMNTANSGYFPSKSSRSPKDWSPFEPFPSLKSARALEYEPSILSVSIKNNPYAGKPRPELEAAWHKMFQHTNIRVHKEDLHYYNVTSLPMTNLHGNEGYFVGQMGVFHELHCLKRIRHWIYRSHYLTNFTNDQLVEEEAHIDHCVELMREAILCRGDTTLSVFRWIDPSHQGDPHLTVDAPGTHTCVNWERLREWNDKQAVDPFESGALFAPRE